MGRKAVVVLVLLFALTPSERLRSALAEADRIATETPLSALFGPATIHIESAPGGMQIADAPNAEVFVARVNSDGTISTACVGTEEAARDFMSGKKKAAGPEKE